MVEIGDFIGAGLKGPYLTYSSKRQCSEKVDSNWKWSKGKITGPSFLVAWFLMVSCKQGLAPHLKLACGCAEMAQGQKGFGKEGQEVEIRVDMSGPNLCAETTT